MSDLNQAVDFIKEIEKLKTVTRFNRTLDGRFENSAEHSWQCAIASMVLQDFYPEKLNIENVISMLLIHDLGEIYAGDTWVFDDKNKVHSHDRELEKKKFIKDESEELWKLTEELVKESVKKGLYL